MKILLVGCGKMGGAILDGWLKGGIDKSAITVVDPEFKGKVKSVKNLSELPKTYKPDYVLLAVKPQIIGEVLPELAKFTDAVFVSIIAGKTIAYYKKHLGKAVIIRTMPNLPAVIGKGITALSTRDKLDAVAKKSIEKLLKPCGKLVWVKDEKLVDSVTAISGSGPAYVFLFADSLIKAATKLGLDEKTAKLLVFETISGSIALAQQSEFSLTKLKENVTSKGGTTAAALEVLETGDRLAKLVEKAAKKAKNRAKQLSE